MGKDGKIVAASGDGINKAVRNFVAQTYIDNGDGLGPVLTTVYIQAVSVVPLDAAGNPLDQDDVINDYEWKRQMLDETRAVRVGMAMLLENRKDPMDADFDLLKVAQSLRGEDEDKTLGRADDDEAT